MSAHVDVPPTEPANDAADDFDAGEPSESAPPSAAAPDDSAPQSKKERGPAQADLLVQIALSQCELFHDDYDDAYATIVVAGHRETYKLRSTKFRSWLDREFFVAFGKAPGGQSKADAIAVLEGISLHDRPAHKVYVRYAEVGGAIYVDLADEARTIVRVDARDWTIVTNAPVKFLRPKGMLPLPRPVRGGSVDLLRPFLNVDAEWKFVLVVAWMVASMKPRGPYPILTFVAEHGAAKSTTSKIARYFVDPNVSPIRSCPREVRDLAVAAKSSFALAYDNLSGVPTWLSDALCRVATGGGFSTRTLYSDDAETIFDFVRPIILNGIDDMAERADLADRCLLVPLPAIPRAKRKREKTLWAALGKVAPAIFGALLTGLVGAVRDEDSVELDELPRMADFAAFAAAAETSLGWAPGTFVEAYAQSQRLARQAALEADAVAVAIVAFMGGRPAWSGCASDLLGELNDRATDDTKRSREWPKAAHILSNRVRRAAPFLRTAGIAVELGRNNARSVITFSRRPEESRGEATRAPLATPARENGFVDGGASTESKRHAKHHEATRAAVADDVALGGASGGASDPPEATRENTEKKAPGVARVASGAPFRDSSNGGAIPIDADVLAMFRGRP